jgi:hypothetical protein
MSEDNPDAEHDATVDDGTVDGGRVEVGCTLVAGGTLVAGFTLDVVAVPIEPVVRCGSP